MRTFSWPFLVVLLLAPAPLAAQHINSPYRFLAHNQEITLFGGHMWSSQGSLQLDAQTASVFGARYDIRMSGPFNFDAGLSIFPTHLLVRDTTIGNGDTTIVNLGTASQTLAVVDAGLRFDLTGPRTYHNLLPYFVFGVGLVLNASQQQTLDTNIDPTMRYRPGTRFTAEVGGGLEWTAFDRIAMKLDARSYLWRVQAPPGFLLISTGTPAKEWVQHFALTFGLAYRL